MAELGLGPASPEQTQRRATRQDMLPRQADPGLQELERALSSPRVREGTHRLGHGKGLPEQAGFEQGAGVCEVRPGLLRRETEGARESEGGHEPAPTPGEVKEG